jgi:hypothetical protein
MVTTSAIDDLLKDKKQMGCLITNTTTKSANLENGILELEKVKWKIMKIYFRI